MTRKLPVLSDGRPLISPLLVHDPGNVRGQAVHWSSSVFLENDEGADEDGATRPGGGEGGGRYTVSLVTLFFGLSLFPSSFLSYCLSLFPSYLGTGRVGAGGVATSCWRTV